MTRNSDVTVLCPFLLASQKIAITASTMKLCAAAVLVVVAAPAVAHAFARSTTFVRESLSLKIGRDPNVDLGGNAWKPDSEKMGATDTGDYFPEGYDPNAIAYTEGMGGSQAMLGGNRDGPQLPGMENLGADAVVTGGIEVNTDIPEGMEFIPSSVPDGEFEMRVFASASAMEQPLMVAPICMTFEDYYAGFSKDSHPSLSVSPAVGRMDRRGGEPTELIVTCDPRGQSGTFSGDLVINLPEDNSKICYKINVVSQ